jgi:hypothetical protein
MVLLIEFLRKPWPWYIGGAPDRADSARAAGSGK